jgi:excisionase family DNA binding protein
MAKAEFLTMRESAELARVTVVTLRSWRRKGLLTVYSVGGRRLIRKSDLLKLILGSKSPSLAELRGGE